METDTKICSVNQWTSAESIHQSYAILILLTELLNFSIWFMVSPFARDYWSKYKEQDNTKCETFILWFYAIISYSATAWEYLIK